MLDLEAGDGAETQHPQKTSLCFGVLLFTADASEHVTLKDRSRITRSHTPKKTHPVAPAALL